MIISNTFLQGVHVSVRERALQSFEYFANTVLASRLSESLCEHVQDVVDERENATIPTMCPRSLCVALRSYLEALGYNVVCEVHVPRSEILEWLDFRDASRGSVTLSLSHNTVEVSWL